jgi:hypothetical protein
VERYPIIVNVLMHHPIDDPLKSGKRGCFPGTLLQKFPEGANGFCGDDATGVVHMQVVMDFIFVFTALNDKQR